MKTLSKIEIFLGVVILSLFVVVFILASKGGNIGASNLTDLEVEGALTVGGDARVSLVSTGSVTAFTTSTSVTAAQLCDSSVFTVTSLPASSTLTLPTTSTLFADCLTTNGDSISVSIWNLGTVSTTVMAAGTGGTLAVSSSTIIYAADGAVLDVFRDSATTYKALLTNYPN